MTKWKMTLLVLGLTALIAPMSAGAKTQHCPDPGENKIDESGPGARLDCGDGEVVGICVKAGNRIYGMGVDGDGNEISPDEGCYSYSIGGNVGGVGGGGTGRDCKDISYKSFYCGECQGKDCEPPPCTGKDCEPPPCEGKDCEPPPCDGKDCN